MKTWLVLTGRWVVPTVVATVWLWLHVWLQRRPVVWLQSVGVATDRVKRFRCSAEQEARWLAACGGERLFSAWARRMLDEAVQLSEALVREEQLERLPLERVVRHVAESLPARVVPSVPGVVRASELSFRGPDPRRKP